MMGRNEDDVIHELVHMYFRTLKNSITVSKRVIVVGVIPPTKRTDYESKHGPLEEGFPFPFLGTDEERVRYTRKVNRLIEEMCQRDGYAYFNPYAPYTRDDGTLRYELSDTFVINKEFNFITELLPDKLFTSTFAIVFAGTSPA
jgi:hypothetical protein